MTQLSLLALSLILTACSGIHPRYHEVTAGESLTKIATRYEVPVREIEKANRTALSDGLKPGRKLYIPYEKSPKWDEESTVAVRELAATPVAYDTATAQFSWPAGGSISSGYGLRKVARKMRDHEGIDISAPKGSPVRASRSGHVIYASNRISGYGNMVIVKHADDFSTVYAHMQRFSVKKGQFVSRGQKLGTVGNTGRSRGVHLHFEIRLNRSPVNPLLYLQGQYAANNLGR